MLQPTRSTSTMSAFSLCSAPCAIHVREVQPGCAWLVKLMGLPGNTACRALSSRLGHAQSFSCPCTASKHLHVPVYVFTLINA